MTDQKFNCVSIQEKCKELDPGLYNAIQVIQAAFLPVKINNQVLTPGQNILLAAVNYDWQIVADWIICLQTGKLNPKKSPYNLQEFQDRKTWAQVLNSQLNLCAGVQQFKPSHKKYLTHYDRWIACMHEFREWRVKSIIECPTMLGKKPILKEQKVQGMRNFVKALRENGEILLPIREDTKHHCQLLNTAMKLASSDNSFAERERFRQKYWHPFLDAYSRYATDIHNNSELKSVFPWKDGLAYQGKGRFSPITISVEEKLKEILKQQSSKP